MMITEFYPVVATDRIRDVAEFFIEQFGFEISFAADWYMHLQHPEGSRPSIAILDHLHETIPSGFRNPARGVLINIEVDNVDGLYETLMTADCECVLPIRDEPFGQRHFIIRICGDLLVDVIKPIPPSEEFAVLYSDESRPIA